MRPAEREKCALPWTESAVPLVEDAWTPVPEVLLPATPATMAGVLRMPEQERAAMRAYRCFPRRQTGDRAP